MTKKLKVFIARYRIERNDREVTMSVLEQKVRAIGGTFIEIRDDNGYTALASVSNIAIAFNGKMIFLPGSEDIGADPITSRTFRSAEEAKNIVSKLLEISKHIKTMVVRHD